MPKAKLTTRERTTSNVSTDTLAKGSQLTHAEADSNFINLRDQSFGIADDSSTVLQVSADKTITVAGGTGITTALSGDTLTITASGGGGGGASLGDLTAIGSTLIAPSNANLRLQSSAGDVEVQDSFIVSNIQASDETQGEMFRVTSTGATSSNADFNHNGNLSGSLKVYGSDGQSGGGNIPLSITYNAQADVKINGYTMPTDDGSANQIIKTNGSNTLSFVDVNTLISSSFVQNTDTAITVVGDDSSGTGFTIGETLKVAGGNGCSATVSGDTVTIDFDQASIPTQPANAGNFEFSGSTMSGQVTNGDITLQPNGTGDIILDTDTVKVGSGSEAATVQSNGTQNLLLLSGSQSFVLTPNDTAAGAPAMRAQTQFFVVGTGSNAPRICSSGAQDLNIMTQDGNSTFKIQLANNGNVNIDGAHLNMDSDKNITGAAVVNATQLQTQGISINDNRISANRSNDNLEIDATGTGAVDILTQKVFMKNLPTSDPSVLGQLYNDSGTLKISAG